MFLTHTSKIKNLTKKEYEMLREMCLYSRNLYNVGLYSIRQYYFQEKKFLTYENNYHYCKDNENYKMLQAGVSQQILKVVDRSFKSFFNLINKAKKDEYRFQDIRMPGYLKEGMLFPLILSTNAILIKDKFITVPVSHAFKKSHKVSTMQILFPERLRDKKIKEVRILPKYNGNYFDIQYIYEYEKEDLNLNKDNVLGIDIGLENLATCIDNNGTSFIMDGKKSKSINHYYNKKKAKLQSVYDKQEIKVITKRMSKLISKRNNRINDQIKKISRYIINNCIEKDIGKIVIGYTTDFKRNINIGKVNNQQFTQISFGKLRESINNLCDRYGIEYIEQEESYTSKASFIDNDEIPVYKPNSDIKYKFSGRRIKRGLYKSKEGIIINADVNGALNILKKSKQKMNNQLYNGLLTSPLRIRIA